MKRRELSGFLETEVNERFAPFKDQLPFHNDNESSIALRILIREATFPKEEFVKQIPLPEEQDRRLDEQADPYQLSLQKTLTGSPPKPITFFDKPIEKSAINKRNSFIVRQNTVDQESHSKRDAPTTEIKF